MSVVKRVLVGRPISTAEQEHQRIPKTIALAVFSSDAISSTAYATEEILFVTAVGASSLALGLNVLIPISIAVAVLLAIVVTSYRQTIYAYPSGGGSYVVCRENLGEMPSLIAGASLLVDYILTVAVSISAGVAAIVSIPAFRGSGDPPRRARARARSSSSAWPTCAASRSRAASSRCRPTSTSSCSSLLVGYGLFESFFGHLGKVPFNQAAFAGDKEFGGSLTLFIILKGFSSGAVALTGVEAISNGVPAFRRPESKNAAMTLMWMAIILGSAVLRRLAARPPHRAVPEPRADGVLPDGPARVRQRAACT